MTTRRFLADIALSALLFLGVAGFGIFLWGWSGRTFAKPITPGLLILNGNPLRCLDATNPREGMPRSFLLENGQWVTIQGPWIFQPDVKQVAP